MTYLKLNYSVKVLLLLAAVSLSQAVFAKGYQMSIVPGHSQGYLVQQGRYEEAMSSISLVGSRQFPANTNLCVAQAKAGHLIEARASCERAVDAARIDAKIGKRVNHNYAADLAVALTNRGVLRVILGDLAGAEKDFRMAIELHAGSDTPLQNLAILNQVTKDSLAVK